MSSEKPWVAIIQQSMLPDFSVSSVASSGEIRQQNAAG